MKVASIKKTFSLPSFIANRLDEISAHTGYSQSNVVLQALAAFMYRFEDEGEVSLENWLERRGRTSGLHEDGSSSGGQPEK